MAKQRVSRHYRNAVRLYESMFFYRSIKLARACDITHSIKDLYKKNVRFPHPVGIVIGAGATIGYGCTIYQNVTIGTKNSHEALQVIYPRIGDGVIIGASAVLIGNIDIGDNAVIAAGSIVTKSVKEKETVRGVT